MTLPTWFRVWVELEVCPGHRNPKHRVATVHAAHNKLNACMAWAERGAESGGMAWEVGALHRHRGNRLYLIGEGGGAQCMHS